MATVAYIQRHRNHTTMFRAYNHHYQTQDHIILNMASLSGDWVNIKRILTCVALWSISRYSSGLKTSFLVVGGGKGAGIPVSSSGSCFSPFFA